MAEGIFNIKINVLLVTNNKDKQRIIIINLFVVLIHTYFNNREFTIYIKYTKF